MAIYHLEAKVVSRGAGRSAVAASAYLSCSRLYNDYDGIQHDYTKKQGLVWQEVFLPEYAPQEWQDREKLWNAVEEVETAKDSRLAREFVVALPIELSREQQIELLQDFIREQFVSDGMCADAAIHDTDGHNPHAHILLTVRPLDERGKWQYKTEKEYLCMRNGEERGFTAAEFKSAQNDGWEKQYPYKAGKKKVYMSLLEVYHICISNSTLYTSYNLYFSANSQRKHQVQTRHFDRKSTQNATSFHLAIETVLLGVLACFSSAFLAVRRLQTDRKSGLVQKISHTALLMGFFQSAEIGVLFTEQCQSLSQAGIVGVDTGCVLALIKEDDSFFFILRQLRHNFSPCDDSSSYP